MRKLQFLVLTSAVGLALVLTPRAEAEGNLLGELTQYGATIFENFNGSSAHHIVGPVAIGGNSVGLQTVTHNGDINGWQNIPLPSPPYDGLVVGGEITNTSFRTLDVYGGDALVTEPQKDKVLAVSGKVEVKDKLFFDDTFARLKGAAYSSYNLVQSLEDTPAAVKNGVLTLDMEVSKVYELDAIDVGKIKHIDYLMDNSNEALIIKVNGYANWGQVTQNISWQENQDVQKATRILWVFNSDIHFNNTQLTGAVLAPYSRLVYNGSAASNGTVVAENVNFNSTSSEIHWLPFEGDKPNPPTPDPVYQELTVNKEWIDLEDKFGLRPDSITFELLEDGNSYETFELNKANDWTMTFDNLKEKSIYTVVELDTEWYSKNQKTEENTITLENTLKAVNFGFVKVDKEDYSLLPGAKFNIYWDSNLDKIFDKDKDYFIGEFVSKENGVVDVENVPEGLYFIQEVAAPEGYELNTEVFEFDTATLGQGLIIENGKTPDLIPPDPEPEPELGPTPPNPEPVSPDPKPTPVPPHPETPNTGDETQLVTLAIVALAALMGIYFIGKNR